MLIEDQMKEGVQINLSGNLEFPLLITKDDSQLPSDKAEVQHHLKNLLKTLDHKPDMMVEY